MLGEPTVQDTALRLLSIMLTLAAVGLTVRLQQLAAALREREETSRWASNLRDLTNLGAVVAFLGAFLVAGLPTWGAVVAAGTVMIVLELARHLPRTNPGRQKLTIALGLLLALPVVVFPAHVTHGFDAVALALF